MEFKEEIIKELKAQGKTLNHLSNEIGESYNNMTQKLNRDGIRLNWAEKMLSALGKKFSITNK